MKKLLLLLIALCCIMRAWAYDFSAVNSDGKAICYNITSSTPPYQVEVTHGVSYSGDITIPSSVVNNGITYSVVSIGESTFKNCTTLTSVVLPETVTVIGYKAFYQCDNLETINFPESLQYIRGYAFEYCTKLTAASFGTSMIEISDYAFQYCQNISSITFGNSIETIGIYSFCGCKNISQIVIPQNLNSIGLGAFNITNIESFIVDSQNPVYDSRENCNAIIETESNILIAGCKNTIVPNTVTSIGDVAFGGTDIKTIIIPEPVSSIGYTAFGGSGLESITIPATVTSIEHDAFSNSHLSTLVCYAETPPTLGYGCFYAVWPIVYVPEGSIDTYNASEWSWHSSSIKPIQEFSVTATSYPSEGGTITGEGSFTVNEKATLTATANEDYIFSNWTLGGNVVSTDATYTFSVTNNMNLVANFVDLPYLTLTAIEDNTSLGLQVNGSPNISTLQYRLNDGDWINVTGTVSSFGTMNTGDKVQLRSRDAVSNSSDNHITITCSAGKFDASGNVNTLIDYENAETITDLTGYDGCFYFLFKSNTGLVSATNLRLPATSLSDYCYYGMFKGCTSLATTPQLPATILAAYCYHNMFDSCTSLTTAPELPATTMRTRCYESMFCDCTSLAEAPELPATALAFGCYGCMFCRCTSLTEAPELPATTLVMYCYSGMFAGCTSLTTAPELQATTLDWYCYNQMFVDCTSLNSVTTRATSWSSYYVGPDTYSAPDWLAGVSATGNFYNIGRADIPIGAGGIPVGWTEHTSGTIVISANNTDYGTVTGGGTFDYGTTATLTATPNSGYTFVNWTENDEIVSEKAEYNFTVENDRNLVANFIVDADYLTLTAIEDNTSLGLQVNGSPNISTLQYRLNDGDWINVTGTVSSFGTMNTGDKVQLRSRNAVSNSYDDNIHITCSNGKFDASGNANTLIDYVYAETITDLTGCDGCFYFLFKSNNGLVSAANLRLPATSLSDYCYRYMFYYCVSLTTPPNLPAMSLANYCYNGMFEYCESLTSAPDLPAMSLAWYCYQNMFCACRALTTAPALPATSLAVRCYTAMFCCTSLTNAPSLPATSLASGCYLAMFSGCKSLTNAPSLPATSLAYMCYDDMFYGCTNLITAPELPATTLEQACYRGMFEGCTSLTTAPELPATTLADYCYDSMFENCSSLNSVTTHATFWNSEHSNNWLSGVSATGNFYNLGGADIPTGTSGIPTGWTEHGPRVKTITAVPNDENFGAVSGAGSYLINETCTLTATPNSGYTFVNWTENGSVVSTDAEYSFTVTGNRILVANFNGGQYPDEVILGQTYYDWQSNAGARNYTAVWPDGFAAMAWTTSTKTNFTDRGTGIATFDPATGEWTPSAGRVEPVKTGFGSIARYKENGLVVAAHTANDVRIWINEDFRDGGTTWTEVQLYNGSHDACWPVVQCSGENLDVIHILYTDNGATSPYGYPLYYSRYQNGQWTVEHQILPYMDASYISGGGPNIAYFMPYDPAKPNRVAFILNNAWSDGKCMISEDNGQTWSQRVFYQHPNINGDFTGTWFFYPRLTNAAFDTDDNLHVVYAYNGTTGTAGSGSYYPQTGSYYPQIGGIGYWSETLPKNSMCLGGIGNVGQPFIMDSTYLMQDLYKSEWYWSDANHDPLPEYIGEMEKLDTETHQVVPHEYSGDCFWPETSNWSAHGWFGSGKAEWPSMAYDKSSNTIVAVWSQICGDESTNTYFDGTNYYFRLFYNVSYDGGQTWSGTKHLLTDFTTNYYEMTYPVVIPYIYSDEGGRYVWICAQIDEESGTYVQSEETIYDNNFYKAFKLYIDDAPVVTHYTITAYTNLSNAGTVTGGGTFDYGTMATLTATPNSGYTFVNWTENDIEVSTDAEYSFTVESNRDLVANFVAASPGGLHWNPDPYQYADNMDIIAQVQIDGVTQNTTMIEVGAFCGNEVRGSSRITYSDKFHKYIVNLKVYGESNDVISFKIYDHQTATEPDYRIPATVTFTPNAIIGNNISPYIIGCFSSVLQSNSLAAGWNWYSSFIDTSGEEGFSLLTTALGDNATAVKSQTGISMYYSTYNVWDGSLTTFGNEQMYMIQMSKAATLELEGHLTELADTPLTLQSGWNWISYPSNVEMPLDEALATFSPADGDCFKSQTGVAIYYAGYGWDGSLSTLSPGLGYMYKNNTSSVKTLTYSAAGSKGISGTNSTTDGNYWQPDIHTYPDNMNIIASVSINGEELSSENFEIGVFSNGECRGSARLVYKEKLDKYIMFLTVYGNEGDNLSFRLYDTATNTEYDGEVGFSSVFTPNAIVGSVFNPYIIDFGVNNVSEHGMSEIFIYPNPARRGDLVNIGFSCERIQVVNSLGVVIKEYTNTNKIESIDTAGMYYILLINGNSISYNKLVVE